MHTPYNTCICRLGEAPLGPNNPTVSLQNFMFVFLGRDPGTLKSDIVSTKTSTIILFGFETLKFKIRRLKLWKPTVGVLPSFQRPTFQQLTINQRFPYSEWE